MASFRALQPAPLDQAEPPPPQPQSRPLLTQKPKRTVTLGACVACRKRKSKCDGNRPMCTCCSQKDTECIYELGPNEKPSQAMKRKNEEMQGELLNLRQVYDFLRLRPEAEAQEILRRIRTNAPGSTTTQQVKELAEFVKHGDLGMPPPTPLPPSHPDDLKLPPLRVALESVSPGPHAFPSPMGFPPGIAIGEPEVPAGQRRRYDSDADVSTSRSGSQDPAPPPGSIAAILGPSPNSANSGPVDARLFFVKNWTIVTDDEPFLIHLLQVWHRQEYSFYHFIDWDNFLDDMSTGRTTFCSRLLVNILLASASFLSPHVKDRSIPFTDNIITAFYKEARRIWEQEEGQENLPRVQAAILLYLVISKHGRDKIGHSFLLEACRIAKELGLFRISPSPSITAPADVPVEKWDRVRAVTAWALFNFQLEMAYTYSFPALLKSQPPLPIPYEECPDSEALFRSECHRHLIMLDCANTVLESEHNDGIPPKPERVEVLYLRFKEFYETRPDSVNPDKNPCVENLLAALLHNTAMITLIHPFLDRNSSLERIKSYRDRAQSIANDCTKELRRLVWLQEARHGWSNIIPLIMHSLMILSFNSLEEIANKDPFAVSIESTEQYRGLISCFRALHSLTFVTFYAQPLFRLVTQASQGLGLRLPSDMSSILSMYETEEWTKNAADIVSSQYCTDIRKTAEELENTRMDSIIRGWGALNIKSDEEASSRSPSADSLQTPPR